MEYLKKIAFEGMKHENDESDGSCRNDVFQIRTFGDRRKIILNENKLQSIYK